MSKMLLTNNKYWSEFLRGIFSNAGFSETAHRTFAGTNSTFYQKLNIKNINYVETESSFVACTGSCIYKGLFGPEALQAILADSATESIDSLRAKMVGSYAVVIKKNNTINIFIDETHTYDMYYHVSGDGEYIVTNTYYHIIKCIGGTINPDAVIERGVRGGILGLATPFTSVRALGAREYIEIDLTNQTFKVKACMLNCYCISFSSKEEAIKEIGSRAQKIAEIRAKYFKKSLYFVTGGVDSRLELASAVANNENIKLGYWMGSDSITNGTSNDCVVQAEIADRLSCNYERFDTSVSYDTSLHSLTSDLCDKFGELASIYCGNRKWISIFETQSEIDYFGFGYFGEMLRPIGSIDEFKCKSITVREFIEKVYCRTHLNELITTNSFYQSLIDEISDILNSAIDEYTQVDMNTCGNLFGYSRFSADCILTNFSNLFAYSFPLLGGKEISDAIFCLPYEWKAGDHIALSLTEFWNSELLDIPYFSHHKKQRINTKKMELEVIENSHIKNLLKKSNVIRNIYRHCLRPLRKTGDEWIKMYSFFYNELKVSPLINLFGTFQVSSVEPNEMDIATLATFVAQIRVYEYALGLRS